MKLFNYALIGVLTLGFSITSCDKDETTAPDGHDHDHGTNITPTNDIIDPANGNTLTLKFEHMVGTQKLVIDSDTISYRYKNSKNQDYNISTFGYYISNVVLHKMGGGTHKDSVLVSAAKVKGVYLINQDTTNEISLVLGNIPTGHYTGITYTVGVPENIVQQGAAGGVLDPAAGAWFWNWNAGYVSTKIEGVSPQSSNADKSISYHIGGWKDIDAKFVDNIKTVTLDFGSTHAMVANNTQPSAHIFVDAAKLINGSNIDFATNPGAHSPAAGKVFADQLTSSFIFNHVHN